MKTETQIVKENIKERDSKGRFIKGHKVPKKIRKKIGEGIAKKVKELKVTPEMAYIMGAIKGDGLITRWNIRLEVNDKDFIEEFKKNVEKWISIKCKIYQLNTSTKYQAYVRSVKVANYLRNFNYKNLINYCSKIKAMFLRGIYDSEGSVSVKAKGIFLFNNNEHLLSFCKKLLAKLKIETTPIRICSKIGKEVMFKDRSYIRKNNTHQLSIYGKENIKRFNEVIGFSIDRKNIQVNKILASYKK